MDSQDSPRDDGAPGNGVHDLDLHGRALARRWVTFRGRRVTVAQAVEEASARDSVLSGGRVRFENRQAALSRDTLRPFRLRIEHHPLHLGLGKNPHLPHVHGVCSLCRQIHGEEYTVASWVLGWKETRVCAYVEAARRWVSRSASRRQGVRHAEAYRRAWPFRRRSGEDDVDYLTRCYQARAEYVPDAAILAELDRT